MRPTDHKMIGISLAFVIAIGIGLVLLIIASLGAPTTAQAAPPDRPLGAAVTRNICAKAGTLTLADATTVPIWGFADNPGALACSDPSITVTIPGPVLIFTAGDSVTINLGNALPGGSPNVSMLFQGIPGYPDTTGVAPGSSTSYSFVAANPGTYLYESNVPEHPEEVPMGLYGAMIVRPATAGRAYNPASTAFDLEATLVLSEIDPNLNASPVGFNFLEYAPKYWLINGKSYPDTDPIMVTANQRLLLRVVNAGLQTHTPSLLGMRQRVIAVDAFLQPIVLDSASGTPGGVVRILSAGQTYDALTVIPGGATPTQRWPLYDRHLYLTNAGAGPGGMLVFIKMPSAAAMGPTTMFLPLILRDGTFDVQALEPAAEPAPETRVEAPAEPPKVPAPETQVEAPVQPAEAPAEPPAEAPAEAAPAS